jgi:OmcA/MtrC family decaheme c-type cytochrome
MHSNERGNNMEKQRRGKWWRLLVASLAVLSLALAGCEGDDGDDGAPGPPGPPGSAVINAAASTPDALSALEPVATITSVSSDPKPVVQFTVVDSISGVGIAGIQTINAANPGFVRMDVAKLVPPAANSGDPTVWVNYIRSSTTNAPTTESNGTLVDNGDGSYTYTFTTDITTVAGVPYQPTLTHRVAGQIGSSSIALPAMNLVFDYVPAGGPVTTTRLITSETNCNQCHNPLVIHGRRFRIDYCVTCHNPDLASGEGNMPFMTHRIHWAGPFAVLDDAVDYSEVTYPQDVRNCRKCHSGLPDSDNWMDTPTIAACSGCHSSPNFPSATAPAPVDFATGANHAGGAQADNSGCVGCHDPASIELAHLTDNATPNNPNVPAGAVNFTYEISGVTVNASNQAVVVFRILADGTPVVFGAPGTTLLTGFTGSPSFLVAYALPQEGITTPADYNNLGKSAAQPASVSITNLWNGTQGTLAGPDQNGFYTATLNGTADAARFPAGATQRAVGLQGYFTQVNPAVARHTRSVVKNVTGDTARRAVVSSAACVACHEIFEGHGGNRVITVDGGVEICTLCHVPNLSSSGRGADPANVTDPILIALGSPLNYPEDSNNLKDMIHGIHASGARNFDYEFVRDRGTSGVFYYNWAEVTFPGNVAICTTCHIPPSRNFQAWQLPLNSNVLNTTVRTTGAADGLDVDRAAVLAARASVPNLTDWVNTPTASTCYYCHDSVLAVAHMRQNGGIISVADPAAGEFTQRQNVNTVESCAVCHGPGTIADLSVVHGL